MELLDISQQKTSNQQKNEDSQKYSDLGFEPIDRNYSIDSIKEDSLIDEDYRKNRYRSKGESADTIGYGHFINNKEKYYKLANDLGIKDPENPSEPEAKRLFNHDFDIRREEIEKIYPKTSSKLLDIMTNKKLQYSPKGFEKRFGAGLKTGNTSV